MVVEIGKVTSESRPALSARLGSKEVSSRRNGNPRVVEGQNSEYIKK